MSRIDGRRMRPRFTPMRELLHRIPVLLASFFICSSSLPALATKPVLILVTGADKMTNGKPTGLWLEEFAVPYNELTKAGFEVEVVTPKGGVAPIDARSNPDANKAAAWEKAAKRLNATKPLAAVNAEDFSAIFVPGGHGTMFDLAVDPNVAQIIQEFDQQGKPVAAVCHGPAAFVKAVKPDGTPLVKGRKVTAFTDSEERAVELDKDMPFLLETKLRDLGATVETKENFTSHAIRDGNLITGQNPASSESVAKLLIEALSGKNN